MITSSIDRINILAGLYPEHVVIQPQIHNRRRVFRYTGKMMCAIDEDLLNVLLSYNQLTLPGITFSGIGDQQNTLDLYRLTGNCWESNSALCPYFLVFAISTSGKLIGSLTNYKDAGKKFPVAYLSSPSGNTFTIIGSSFEQFLKNMIDRSIAFLSTGNKYVDDAFLTDTDFWQSNDTLLHTNIQQGYYKLSAEDNWKKEFGYV